MKRESFQQGSVILENGNWYFRYRLNGKLQPRIPLGTIQELPNKAAARKAATPYRPAAEKASDRHGVRLRAVIEQYKREALPELKFSTRAAYQNNLENHILPKWGNECVTSLDPYTVSVWLKALPLSAKSKVHLRGLLRILLENAMLWKFIPVQRNPMELVKIKGASKREVEPIILTVEQFHSLLGSMDKEPFRTMVLVAMCLGLRVSELLALKWKDVDWQSLSLKIERGIVRGHVDEVKTRFSRKSMPLDKSLLAVLKAWRAQTEFTAQEDWIWASPWMAGEQPYYYTTLLAEIQKAAKDSGLTGVGWHTLRHSFRTWVDETGAEIGVQQRLMRHADIRTTMNQYGDVIPKTLRRTHGKVVKMAIKSA